MSPFIDSHAPIVYATSSICFVGSYIVCCILIAAYIDIPLAILFMIIILIWIQVSSSKGSRRVQHFESMQNEMDMPNVHTPLVKPQQPEQTDTKEQIVKFNQGDADIIDVMNLKQQLDIFKLAPCDEEPLSMCEYEPSKFMTVE